MNQMNPMEFMKQFNEFRQQFQQKNPNMTAKMAVQKMLDSGQMSQQQFEQCRAMAVMVQKALGI